MKLFKRILSSILTAALLLCSGLTAQAEERRIFSDVAPWAWYAEAVNALAGQGVIGGMPDGTFRPGDPISRAQFLKLLAEASAKEIRGNRFQQKFSDVSPSDWFADYVAWGVKEKLITGVGGGRFAPNSPVTRQQIAVILYRFNKNAMGKQFPTYQKTNFADAASISAWATYEVRAVEGAGLMKGYSDRTFRPKKNATRAEAAQIVYQYILAAGEFGKGCSVDELRYIVHGGGLVDNTYLVSNSLEALEESYKNGNYFIEMDFNFTTDEQLAIVHSWGDGYPPKSTLDEFLSGFIFRKLTPLSLDRLSMWLRDHPEVRILADFKERSLEGLRMVAEDHPELVDRFVPYVYHLYEYDEIRSLGYQNMILTLYQMSQAEKLNVTANMNFIREKGIAAVACAPNDSAAAHLEKAKSMGIPFLYFTIDDPRKMEEYAYSGADGFLTNYQNYHLDW